MTGGKKLLILLPHSSNYQLIKSSDAGNCLLVQVLRDFLNIFNKVARERAEKH